MLARVKRGEEVTVTERGETIARILPASARPLDALITSGRVQPAAAHGPVPRPKIPMQEGDADGGTFLQRIRDEERH